VCVNAAYFPSDLAKVAATLLKQSESQRKEITCALFKVQQVGYISTPSKA